MLLAKKNKWAKYKTFITDSLYLGKFLLCSYNYIWLISAYLQKKKICFSVKKKNVYLSSFESPRATDTSLKKRIFFFSQ